MYNAYTNQYSCSYCKTITISNVNCCPINYFITRSKYHSYCFTKCNTWRYTTTTWLYNGTASSPAITGNTYVVNVERIGTYQVLIQESFVSPALVCANQSAVVTINATVSDKLFIFPSPNDGRFTVSYYNNGGATTKRKIVIVDSRGATVYNREFSISGLYTLLNINLERASRGIYYVLVGDASGIRLADGRVHVR